jgi:hypothetical protein
MPVVSELSTVEWQSAHVMPTERRLPSAEERAEFDALCEEMAGKLADLFERRRLRLERAFDRTTLGERGWEFSDVAQYLFARVQRGAREALERREVALLGGGGERRLGPVNGAPWTQRS